MTRLINSNFFKEYDDVLRRLASCLNTVCTSWRNSQRSRNGDLVEIADWVAWYFQSLADDFDADFPEMWAWESFLIQK